MAWRVISTKPLPKSILIHCHLWNCPLKTNLSEFDYSNYQVSLHEGIIEITSKMFCHPSVCSICHWLPLQPNQVPGIILIFFCFPPETHSRSYNPERDYEWDMINFVLNIVPVAGLEPIGSGPYTAHYLRMTLYWLISLNQNFPFLSYSFHEIKVQINPISMYLGRNYVRKSPVGYMKECLVRKSQGAPNWKVISNSMGIKVH